MFIGSQVFIQWKLHSVRRTEVEVSTRHECLLGKELSKEKLDGASSKRGVCDFRSLGEINKLVEKGTLDYHGALPRGGIDGGAPRGGNLIACGTGSVVGATTTVWVSLSGRSVVSFGTANSSRTDRGRFAMSLRILKRLA